MRASVVNRCLPLPRQLGTLPRTPMASKMIAEFRKTAQKVGAEPWKLRRAEEYLQWWTHCNATRTWPEAPQVHLVLQRDRLPCKYGLGQLSSELAAFAPATPKRVWARVPQALLPLPPSDDCPSEALPGSDDEDMPGLPEVKQEVDEEDLLIGDLAAAVLPQPDRLVPVALLPPAPSPGRLGSDPDERPDPGFPEVKAEVDGEDMILGNLAPAVLPNPDLIASPLPGAGAQSSDELEDEDLLPLASMRIQLPQAKASLFGFKTFLLSALSFAWAFVRHPCSLCCQRPCARQGSWRPCVPCSP